MGGIRATGSWVEDKAFRAWYEEQKPEKGEDPLVPWNKFGVWGRADFLPLYCAKKRVVVFIDDAHKLNGQKLDMACRCIQAAKMWVVSSSGENQLPPSLRHVVLGANPQIINLDSDVAYDATGVLMWVMMALAAGVGMWEVAAVLGGLKMLGKGRWAARNR